MLKRFLWGVIYYEKMLKKANERKRKQKGSQAVSFDKLGTVGIISLLKENFQNSAKKESKEIINSLLTLFVAF